MSPITEEGRAQMAEAEARRAEARQAVDETCALDVGVMAWWDKAPNGDADTLRAGMVVEVAADSAVVLDSALDAQEFVMEVRRRGARHAASRMLVRARRIALAYVTSTEPRTPRAQVEYARACFASAGIATGEWSDRDDELIRFGRALLDLARATDTEGRAV